MNELPHMQARTQGIHHGALVKVRSNFAGDFRLRDDVHVVVNKVGEQFLGLQESVVVRLMERKRELAESLKITIDAVVVYQLLDGFDGVVVFAEHLYRARRPVSLYGRTKANGQTSGCHAPVAARCAPADSVAFEHSNTGALLGEFKGSGQSGKAGADNRNINVLGDRSAAVVAGGLCSI